MRLDLAQRREVEDQRLWQLHVIAQARRQAVAELDGAKRVEPRLHQRRVSRDAWQQLHSHLARYRGDVD